MADKKTKLTLTGIAKKSIQNIELAKTQSKNTVVIEKKTSRFVGKSSFNRSTDQSNKLQKNLFPHQDQQDFLNPQFQLLIILKNVNLLNRELPEELKVNYYLKI